MARVPPLAKLAHRVSATKSPSTGPWCGPTQSCWPSYPWGSAASQCLAVEGLLETTGIFPPHRGSGVCQPRDQHNGLSGEKKQTTGGRQSTIRGAMEGRRVGWGVVVELNKDLLIIALGSAFLTCARCFHGCLPRWRWWVMNLPTSTPPQCCINNYPNAGLNGWNQSSKAIVMFLN